MPMLWKEEWEKMVTLIATTGTGGLVVGVAKIVITRRYGGWWQWMSLLLAATLTAVLVGLSVHDTGLTEAQQAAIIGVCAFLAEDILMGIGVLASLFSRDPIGTLTYLWRALRGKSSIEEGVERRERLDEKDRLKYRDSRRLDEIDKTQARDADREKDTER